LESEKNGIESKFKDAQKRLEVISIVSSLIVFFVLKKNTFLISHYKKKIKNWH